MNGYRSAALSWLLDPSGISMTFPEALPVVIFLAHYSRSLQARGLDNLVGAPLVSTLVPQPTGLPIVLSYRPLRCIPAPMQVTFPAAALCAQLYHLEVSGKSGVPIRASIGVALAECRHQSGSYRYGLGLPQPRRQHAKPGRLSNCQRCPKCLRWP